MVHRKAHSRVRPDQFRAQDSMKPSSAISASLTDRRILVVEDEYFLADDIGWALHALGAEIVGPVGDLSEALILLDHCGPLDGAILDVNIQDENCFPLARKLQMLQVPFVFTTGYDKSAISAEFSNVSLWEKPINVPAMAQQLAQLILAR